MPVKMDLGTRAAQVQQSHAIAQTKELPPKVEDNTFKNKTINVKSIDEEYIK